MSTIQAIIFDLDDTLYSERSFAFSGFDAVAHGYTHYLGDPEKTAQRMKACFDAGETKQVFNHALKQAGIKEDIDLVQQMICTYRSHTPIIALHEDAEKLLPTLVGRFRLGVISDGFLATQQAKVDALRLERFGMHVILTDQWGRNHWKPNPRAYEEMAKALDVEPTRMVYIADNAAKDFVASCALGWKSIHVVRENGIYRNKVSPEGGEPDITVESLDKVPLILSRW